MNRIKYSIIVCILALAAVTIEMPAWTMADESETHKNLKKSQVGYGRGGRVQAGSTSAHAEEPIQPIPITFDYDRAKVELGK